MDKTFYNASMCSSNLLIRYNNFISGPSRTGDIEQTIVLGAHGPCAVHLVLLESL